MLNSMLGNISLYGMIAAGFFGIIGLGYFVYGKKAANYVFLICGIVLMAYPYFVTRTVFMIIVGLVVSAAPLVIKA